MSTLKLGLLLAVFVGAWASDRWVKSYFKRLQDRRNEEARHQDAQESLSDNLSESKELDNDLERAKSHLDQ